MLFQHSFVCFRPLPTMGLWSAHYRAIALYVQAVAHQGSGAHPQSFALIIGWHKNLRVVPAAVHSVQTQVQRRVDKTKDLQLILQTPQQGLVP